MTLSPAAVRHGRVRGRYFRENFAQGGIDLVQIVPELVTNADAAIGAGGRSPGRIELAFGPPDAELLERWRSELRPLRVPALLDWKHELRCTDDGEGIDAELVDRRLGALGVTPADAGQRGLFGRGLRDVWLAQGGGRIEGVRDDRLVESWFFPAAGDDPYAYAHVRDEPATPAARAALGIADSGTRVSVPLAAARLPAPGRLRTLIARLVQLRPVLEDPGRELWLALPGESLGLVTYPHPEPDPEHPLLFDDEVQIAPGVSARMVVRRAAEAFTLGPSRATRRGGLVVRSGRAAHEATLAARGPSRSAAPLRRGPLRGARGAPATGAGLPAPAGRRACGPRRPQRAPPDGGAPVRGDRQRAATDRGRRGAARRRAPDRSRTGGEGARPAGAAGAQRRAARRL